MINLDFTNFASTTLSVAATSTATTLTLSSTANLPTSIPIGQQLVMTLNDAATGSVFEIVYVTAISGSNITVIRAQEGTSAVAWNANDFIYADLTSGWLNSVDAEIISVLTAAGITPNSANNGQLLASLQKLFAALNGSSSQVFNVANATTSTEALPLGQAQADFAALNGSSSQVFNVANATTSTEALALGQAQTALNGLTEFVMPTITDANAPVFGWAAFSSSAANIPASSYGILFTVVNQETGTPSPTPETSNWVFQYAYTISQPNFMFFRQNINNGGWTAWQSTITASTILSGGSVNGGTATTLSTSVSFTPSVNTTVYVNGNAGCGSAQTVTNLSITATGGTVQHTALNWTNGSTLGVGSALVYITAGTATTITLSVTANASSSLSPQLTYLGIPS